jgi:hypothetical protein
MEINIPRNLAGVEAQGGYGGAVMQVGESISRTGSTVGGLLDNIQENYDYNSFTEFALEGEARAEEHFLETTTKDDGSNPKAFEEYQQSRKKIIDEVVEKAGKVNQRVGDLTKRHFMNRSFEYDRNAQKAFYSNMIKKSIKVDGDQAQITLDTALSRDGNAFENVSAAIEETRVKISAREGLYGANTQTVFDGAISQALLYSVDNALKDPAKSRKVIEMMKDPVQKEKLLGVLTPEGKNKMLSILEVMSKEVSLETGMSIGTAIFKNDKTGSLESMTDAVRSQNLDVETTKAAVTQIKELYSERRTDDIKRAKDAVDKVNAILNPIALKRNGINRVSDLTPDQWAELEKDNPEYAKQLQDSMRRELDYEIRQRKQDDVVARQERLVTQSENEQNILLDDNFRTHDLKSELATGKISTLQYNRLRKMQDSMDPLKRDSVKAALSRVTTGGGLAAALGGLEKNEEANWKLKYSELIKAFAENNIDDPSFDTKLADFMEKHVFSDMATSWFSTDTTDRIDKYNTALKAADPMRNDAIALLRANKKPVTEANIRHIVNKMKGRK